MRGLDKWIQGDDRFDTEESLYATAELYHPKIITNFIYPPIPLRTCDWEAHYDGQEEWGSGYGRTEQEAIASLLEDDLINELLEGIQ
jgi:hypothetical protein